MVSFPLWISMTTRLANSGVHCPDRTPNRKRESGDHCTLDVPNTRFLVRLTASSNTVRCWPLPSSSAASHLPSGDQAPAIYSSPRDRIVPVSISINSKRGFRKATRRSVSGDKLNRTHESGYSHVELPTIFRTTPLRKLSSKIPQVGELSVIRLAEKTNLS